LDVFCGRCVVGVKDRKKRSVPSHVYFAPFGDPRCWLPWLGVVVVRRVAMRGADVGALELRPVEERPRPPRSVGWRSPTLVASRALRLGTSSTRRGTNETGPRVPGGGFRPEGPKGRRGGYRRQAPEGRRPFFLLSTGRSSAHARTHARARGAWRRPWSHR
jgi:hypothetical protein